MALSSSIGTGFRRRITSGARQVPLAGLSGSAFSWLAHVMLLAGLLSTLCLPPACAQDTRAAGPLTYDALPGPGAGKQVLLVAGDEEYRSEEALPMLARILAVRHGFRCTVLFSLDPATGTIDPGNQTNLPGLELLDGADLLVLFTRFRELPDTSMKHVASWLASGRPVIGIRTATHAFAYTRDKQSPFARFDWRSKQWPGGFGRQVLGETWVRHHGHHGRESTRGVIEPAAAKHPVLRGVAGIWGPTDVYAVRKLPADARVLVRGQVLSGMRPDSPPVEGPKNDPMMPIVWTRETRLPAARTRRVLCTTIGASVDFKSEGLRRLFVNACYWSLRMEAKIPKASAVEIVGAWSPTPFGFGKHRRGVRPADLR